MADSPLRVAIVGSNYDGVADGVALTLNRLVEYLERHGVNVMVVTVDYKDRKQIADAKGSQVRRLDNKMQILDSRYKLGLPLREEDERMLDEFHPHLLHVASPCPLCLSAMRWAHRRGVPSMATYHTDFASYLKYHWAGALEPMLWWYMGWFYAHCERVYAPTRIIARQLAERGIDASALRVWGRGVATSDFSPSLRSLEWRRSIGVRDDDVMLLFVGRFVKEKNLPAVVSTLRTLVDRAVPHKAVLVGDGQERAALERECPVGTIFTGFLGGKALGRAYASADVFFFPSDTETFGRVTIEAMASGLPVVGAAGGGTLDIITPGVDGFLCPYYDHTAFANNAERLLRDEELRRAMSEAAMVASRRYSWDALMESMMRNYREAAALSLDPQPPLRLPRAWEALLQGEDVAGDTGPGAAPSAEGAENWRDRLIRFFSQHGSEAAEAATWRRDRDPDRQHPTMVTTMTATTTAAEGRSAEGSASSEDRRKRPGNRPRALSFDEAKSRSSVGSASEMSPVHFGGTRAGSEGPAEGDADSSGRAVEGSASTAAACLKRARPARCTVRSESEDSGLTAWQAPLQDWWDVVASVWEAGLGWAPEEDEEE